MDGATRPQPPDGRLGSGATGEAAPELTKLLASAVLEAAPAPETFGEGAQSHSERGPGEVRWGWPGGGQGTAITWPSPSSKASRLHGLGRGSCSSSGLAGPTLGRAASFPARCQDACLTCCNATRPWAQRRQVACPPVSGRVETGAQSSSLLPIPHSILNFEHQTRRAGDLPCRTAESLPPDTRDTVRYASQVMLCQLRTRESW